MSSDSVHVGGLTLIQSFPFLTTTTIPTTTITGPSAPLAASLLGKLKRAKAAAQAPRAVAAGTALAHSMSSSRPVVLPDVDPYLHMRSSSSNSLLMVEEQADILRARMPNGA